MSKRRRVLLCNCARTMALDGGRLDSAGDGTVYRELCRSQITAFEQALEGDTPLLVGCTQEAPLFSEIAEERAPDADVAYVNIRERAGWCSASTDPHPKIAALLAEAMLEPVPAALRTIESDGLCLVYGAGQVALDAARALEGRLSVTLLLTDAEDVLLPPVLDVPVNRGRIRTLTGSLGAFEVTVDGYAALLPSSRGAPEFALPRDGARSTCSLILDLSGATPLVTAPDRRDGYVRADPRDPAAVARAMFKISDMVGTFEKPIYVDYDEGLCVHGRSGKTGCTNCLDACPAGAIADAGETIAIDPGICGGCGSCAARCPTGAIAYRYPQRSDLVERLQTLLLTFARAGGTAPVLLVHDERHGMEVISALARFGDGLPGNVLPLGLHSVAQVGHEAMLAAVRAGAERIVFLAAPQNADELRPLETEVAIASAFVDGLGYGSVGRFDILATADPDAVQAAVCRRPDQTLGLTPTGFTATPAKRDVVRTAVAGLVDAAPIRERILPMPEGAPYGRIAIATTGCTLCLACVSACPTSALGDNPDRPEVRFTENACVQCGLCAATCPEGVITLEARYDTSAEAQRPIVLHSEEPALCTRCGKPFGTQSTINRITERLAGKHWMFRNPEQAALITMCDDCRIEAQWESAEGPFAAGGRPRIMTTDDYLQAEAKGLSVEDFLKN